MGVKRQRPSRRTDRTRTVDDVKEEARPLSNGLASKKRVARISSAQELQKRNPKDTFVKGNIVRISMKNFLTFSDTVVLPGPRLNLIIGPNGTGKSSIVNAVCICFAGRLGLLGRSGDLASFVRHGAEQATVEVWLHDAEVPNGTVKVRRVFDCDGSSTFYINDEKSPAKEVTQLARYYDIQLDNLSQYMPQEKIADFVALKPDELLQITVRSLGGTRKVEQLTKLKASDIQMKNANTTFERKETELNDLKAKNEEMRNEVEAYKKQKELKKRVRLAEKVLLHRQADEFRTEVLQLVQQRKTAEAEVNELTNQANNTQKNSIRQLELKKRAAKQAMVMAKDGVRKTDAAQHSAYEEVDGLVLDLVRTRREMSDIDRTMERNEAKVQMAKNKLADIDARIARMAEQSNNEQDEAELKQAHDEKQKLRDDLYHESQTRTEFEAQYSSAQRSINILNHKINNLSDVRGQRIRKIEERPMFRNTTNYMRLVREMKNARAFRGNVYGPVVAEITTRHQYHARIMQSCVSGWFLGAFVTENSADSRLLIAECRKRFRSAPDVITAPTDENDNLDIHALRMQLPERPVDKRLKDLGIIAMVSEIFEAPDAVRAALNAQSNLHNVHVGDQHAERNMERLKGEEGLRVWYTPSARIQVSGSRYDPNARNLSVETRFRHCDGVIYSGSMEEVEREKQLLLNQIRDEETNMAQAKTKLTELKNRCDSCYQEVMKIDDRIKMITARQRNRMAAAQERQRAVKELEVSRTRADENKGTRKKQQYANEIVRLKEQILKRIPEAVKCVKLLSDAMTKLDETAAERVAADQDYETEKLKNTELNQKLAEARERFESKRADVKKIRAVWTKKKEEAAEAISEEEIQKHLDVVRPWFEQDAAWLENEIERLTGRMQGLATAGPNVLNAYEEREKRIAELEKRISGERARIESMRSEFEEEKNSFLEWLKEGVGYMRTKFSELYSRFGCAGDLELMGTESVEMLELQILVSYRTGAQLRPISATSNSGGEKMCCTMLFCFSLLHEHANMPPFVIVDELNQGLDPSNEMKIMTIMFEDAEKGVAPQSFVVTPKLLPGLPFQSAAKTHVIFNGRVFAEGLVASG